MEIKPRAEKDIGSFKKSWNAETCSVKGFSMQKRNFIYVAFENKKKVGYVSFFIRGGVCFIRQVYVVPKMRGKGIGSGLIRFVEQIAFENKCHKLQLKTSELHKNQLKLYKKLGYKAEATYKNDMHNITWYMLKKDVKHKRRVK